MESFINQRSYVVTEAIDGLLAASGGRLTRLDGDPHIRVVLRTDLPPQQVALISGGGSGHEPAHAGFVGPGMLSAAVCGDVFASPSVEAILAAICAVTGPAGCLLIVKNYTGDRLNFGLAAERARALGLRVRLVIVADDVALPGLAQPRGLAGTLFVHKIAGHLAAQGADLETVAAAAQRAASAVRSLGLSLGTCTLPGQPRIERMAPGMAELGLGIHGEPGARQIPYRDARTAMGEVLAQLLPQRDPRVRHVALLNNLGGVSVIAMQVLARELLLAAPALGIRSVIGPAPLMTSLDMPGFSVSVLAVDEAQAEALAAPVAQIPAWPGCLPVVPVTPRPLPPQLQAAEAPAPSNDPVVRAHLTAICTALIDAEADLNALDARTGDGDTGSTAAGAARTLLAGIDRLPLATPAPLLAAIGQQLSRTMGGSSGVLLAIFCTAAGRAVADGASLPAACQQGLAQLQAIGGAQAGDRTLIDALQPALAALASHGLAPAARAARTGADATAALTVARAGRSSYVAAAQLEGHIDPGAEAVARVFARLAALD